MDPLSGVLTQLRAVGVAAAAGCAVRALYDFQVTGNESEAWWLMLAAVVLSAAALLGLRYPAPEPAPAAIPSSPRRRGIGLALAAAGAILWGLATWQLYRDWIGSFDAAWIGWTTGTVLLAVGLDVAWGSWPPRPAARDRSAIIAAAVLLLIAGLYRLGNIADFPGEAAITQIEDLQVGNFGWFYLHGYRLRWEYLSSTWLAALGIWLGGPSQLAMRIPFAAVSALKLLPMFVWLRLTVGTAGAIVGAALLATSFWDVTLSRIPNNHNALVVAIVFALLAGPVRRGRPFAYVLLGFLSAYILHEYIGYRPLAVFAIAGAAVWSLRDRSATWPWRMARPLLTLALVATMTTPLFFNRLRNTLWLEYFDGWNRARGISGYYNPEDTWRQTLDRRLRRGEETVELFTVRGDRSPVRNVAGQPPLIDPVTCALLLLGIGAAAAKAFQPVFGLTLLGLAVTVSGTLILTGNFDVARVGGAVPYVYVLAGYGAAAIWSAWSAAWGRVGRVLAALLLAIGVAGAAYWCTGHLRTLWTDPTIRRAHRNNLAYLAIWMRERVHPGERVLGISPGYTNALEGHDGSWLRGGEVDGYVGWDIETALRRWQREPGPTLLFVYDGGSTDATAEFLASILPGVTFTVDRDPLELGADVAYARLAGPPPELGERLAAWHCRGVHADISLVAPNNADVLFRTEAVAPFIAKITWPQAIPEKLYTITTRPGSIRAQYRASFTVATGGEYLFGLEVYAGKATLIIDGVTRTARPVQLEPGVHTLEINAEFVPLAWEPSIRLLWSGPDTGNRQELMPFYRLATIDPNCVAPDRPANAAVTARTYLVDWVSAGPFDNAGGAGVDQELIELPRLAAPPPPGRVGPSWAPVPARGAFIDLDAFYARTAADGNPRWVCAYAATTVTSGSARTASLELAGSGDAAKVWLNDGALTPAAIVAATDAVRLPIELRAGENLLVVKSCEAVGPWYFTARITDAQGRDVPGLHATASLPTSPVSVQPPDGPS